MISDMLREKHKKKRGNYEKKRKKQIMDDPRLESYKKYVERFVSSWKMGGYSDDEIVQMTKDAIKCLEIDNADVSSCLS